MEEWVEGSFEVWSPDGSRTVHGVVLALSGFTMFPDVTLLGGW